jgi:hypothetical protein
MSSWLETLDKLPAVRVAAASLGTTLSACSAPEAAGTALTEDWDARSSSSRMPSALGYLLRNAAVVCGSSAPAKRLAERLWDSDIRRGSALVHRPSHIPVDLVYVDEADPGLCRDIAIIKHCSYRPVVIRGTKQVRAPYLIDDPSSRCNLRFRGDPRCRRGSQLRWWRGRRCRLLRWWSRRLRACAETACQ